MPPVWSMVLLLLLTLRGLTFAQPFVHPGVLQTQADFDRMTQKINASEQPYLSGWNKLTSSPYSASGWTPRATSIVIRGGTGDNVALLYNDVARAYQTALRWKISGSTAHGDTARNILNSWSATLTSIDGNADRYLAVGLNGYQFAAAAEIMRGYPGFDVARAQGMFYNVFYKPKIERFLYSNEYGSDHNGAHIENYWANWDLCNMAAATAIGIFCDRRDIYERAIDYYKYGAGNGSIYHVVPYLHDGDSLGQWQESGRDQSHTTLGMGLLASMAETAWNQGDDLYGWANNRLLKGAEYVARYNERWIDVPYSAYSWYSGNPGSLQTQWVIASWDRGASRPIWEMIYNHYANRKGVACDNVTAAANSRRPEGGPDASMHPSTFDQPGFGTLCYSRPVGTGGNDAQIHLGNIGDGIYTIIARHSSKALQAAGTDNGANVVQQTVNGGASQQWQITHLGGGEYRIVSVPSGRSLDIAGGSHDNSVNAQLWDATDGANQRFAFIPISGGYYQILPTHSSKSVSVSSGSTADGANVWQYKFLWNDNQQWQLVKSPNAPQTAPSLSASGVGDNQIILSWSPSPGATSYTIKRSYSYGGPFRIIATGVTGTTYGDDLGGKGQTFYYTVSPVNDTGEGVSSAPAGATTGNGVWSYDGGGVWGDPVKWTAGYVPAGTGASADFSTVTLSGAAIVTLDAPRSVDALRFGGGSGSPAWTLAPGGGQTLTLAPLSVSASITVTRGTATLATSLAGVKGLDKSGSGTLVLAGSNTLSGILNIDTVNTTSSDGAVRLAHPKAAGSFSTIQIRNGNGGSSTLELDGSQGPVATSAAVSLAGRNNSVPAIRNVAGTNLLNGTISVVVGGSDYRIQSDAGRLTLGANVALTAATTGSRIFTLQGNGEGLVSGRVLDGSGSVSIVKTGLGTWALDGINGYSGTTTVSQGELAVHGNTGAGGTTVSSGATFAGDGNIGGNLTAQTGAKVRVGDMGFALKPYVPPSLVDNFEAYPVANLGAAPNNITGDIWLAAPNITSFVSIADNSGNRAVSMSGYTGSATDPWRGAVSDLQSGRNTDFSLPNGQTGTYFFRVKSANVTGTDCIFGLSDQAAVTNLPPASDTASPWDEYAVTASIGSGNLRASTGASGTVVVAPMSNNAWLNVWLIVNNSTKTFQIATSSGTNSGTLFGQTIAFGRRVGTTVGTNALRTFGIHEKLGVVAQVDDLHFLSGVNLSNPLAVQGLVPTPAILNVTGAFTLPSGATLEFDVSSSNRHDRLVVGGQFNASGTLRVTLEPGQPAPSAGDSYDLFDFAGGTVNFASLDLPALAPGLGWNTSGISSGLLNVVTVGPGGSAMLTNSITGGGSALSLSWPSGQGWRLQMQTNNLSTGLSTNWVYLTDGSVSSTNIAIDAAQPTAYFRLVYP